MEKISYKEWREKVAERICTFGGGVMYDGDEYAEEMLSHAEEYDYAKKIYEKGLSIAKSAQKIVYKYTCQKIPVKFFE